MNRPIAIALGLAALVAGGVLHGVYAGPLGQVVRARRRRRADRRSAAVVLPTGHRTINRATPPSFAQAGAEAYWTRVYRKTGKEFLVILMAGRSGRMAVHTPEVCYRGAGYDLAGPPVYHPVRTVRGQETRRGLDRELPQARLVDG